MQSNSDLWTLIHSLTKTEKRYFKRYAQLWGDEADQSYLRLFDLMHDAETYSPQGIASEMDDPHFEKRYSAHKNYLHQLICRAMRAYHSEKSAINRLHGLLSDAAFLYQKTLFSQSQKSLRKAWKIASELELFTYMLEVLRWERRLLKRVREKNRADQLAEISHSILETLHLFNEELHLQHLYETVYSLNQSAHDLNQTVEAVFAANQEWTEKPPKGSFQAKHFFLQIHIYRTQLHGDLPSALTYQRKQAELWDSNLAIQAEEPFRYASVLANYLSLLTINHDLDTFEELRNRIAHLRMDSPLEQFQISQQLHYLDLLYCLNNPTHSNRKTIISNVEGWLSNHRGQLNTSRWIAFGYNLSILHFLNGHYSDSLKWVRELNSEGHQPERKDAQAFLQLLLYLLYFELGEPELLESHQRALGRYLKLYYDHSYPKFMLGGLGKAFLAPAGKMQAEAFTQLFHQIQDHSDRNRWESDLGFKEIMLWLQQKVKG